MADDIDADLDVDAGAELVELCRRLQRRFAQRQLDGPHQLDRQILDRDMENRQVGVAQRPLAVDELQPDADVLIGAIAFLDNRLPGARLVIETDPVQRLAEPRQHDALGIADLVGGNRLGEFDRGDIVDRRRQQAERRGGDPRSPRAGRRRRIVHARGPVHLADRGSVVRLLQQWLDSLARGAGGPAGGGRRSITGIAGGRRRARLAATAAAARLVEQDIGLARVQQLLRQFAMLHFLPLVVGQDAHHGNAPEADQTHLQVRHVDS